VAHDSSGNTVMGAMGKLTAYHFARVTELTRAEVVEVTPGDYQAVVDCSRDGMWKIDLRLQSGEDRFLFDNEVEFAIATEPLPFR